MKIGTRVLDLWLFSHPIIPNPVLWPHIPGESILQHLKTSSDSSYNFGSKEALFKGGLSLMISIKMWPCLQTLELGF